MSRECRWRRRLIVESVGVPTAIETTCTAIVPLSVAAIVPFFEAVFTLSELVGCDGCTSTMLFTPLAIMPPPLSNRLIGKTYSVRELYIGKSSCVYNDCQTNNEWKSLAIDTPWHRSYIIDLSSSIIDCSWITIVHTQVDHRMCSYSYYQKSHSPYSSYCFRCFIVVNVFTTHTTYYIFLHSAWVLIGRPQLSSDYLLDIMIYYYHVFV